MSIEQEQPVDYSNISNAEIKAKWGLPDNIDPYEAVSYTHLRAHET